MSRRTRTGSHSATRKTPFALADDAKAARKREAGAPAPAPPVAAPPPALEPEPLVAPPVVAPPRPVAPPPPAYESDADTVAQDCTAFLRGTASTIFAAGRVKAEPSGGPSRAPSRVKRARRAAAPGLPPDADAPWQASDAYGRA